MARTSMLETKLDMGCGLPQTAQYIDIIVRNNMSIVRRMDEMEVTATELKKNLGYYLELSRREDVLITKNGHVISKLTSPAVDKRAIVESWVGIIPSDTDVDALMDERRMSK